MRKKAVLLKEAIEMGGMFPFTTIVLYKKGATIDEIIREAAEEDENLKPLTFYQDDPSLSLVFKHEGTTVAYMVVDDNISVDTLVHESDHVVFSLFEIIGSNINADTEEFFAYLDTHIFREVYKVITNKFKLKPPMIYNEEG